MLFNYDSFLVFVIYADTLVMLSVLEDADRLALLDGGYIFIGINIRLDAVSYDRHSLLEGRFTWPVYTVYIDARGVLIKIKQSPVNIFVN